MKPSIDFLPIEAREEDIDKYEKSFHALVKQAYGHPILPIRDIAEAYAHQLALVRYLRAREFELMKEVNHGLDVPMCQ